MFVFRLPSPLGLLTISGDGANITGLWMEGQRHFPLLEARGVEPAENSDGLSRALTQYGRESAVENRCGFGSLRLAIDVRQSDDRPEFVQTRRWLSAYFSAVSGKDLPSLPPLAPQGTPFQRAVWAILQTIPYGTVTTYGAVARTLAEQTGRNASPRAVGGAVGRNPISILIPCHRVVGADGSLTGYAGGMERKRFLLRLEQA